MIGLVVELTDDLNFYTTYSSAFETPTTTEFAIPGGGGGFNQTLVPQSASNFEVGLRGVISEAQRYEVAVFTIDVEDELIGTEITGSPGAVLVRQRRQDDARRPGVLVDRESHRAHPNHGQLYLLGFHVRRVRRNRKCCQPNPSAGNDSHECAPQRQRDPRHAREPAVRRVFLSRAPRVVRRHRRDSTSTSNSATAPTRS